MRSLTKSWNPRALFLVLALAATGCTLDNPKRRFILADRLWAEKKYEASAAEFEKIAASDPGGELGLSALYRAAVIDTTNLDRHQRATEHLKKFIAASNDKEAVWTAKQLLVDLYFEKLERYEETVDLATSMIRERPDDVRAAELTYRVARSYFFLNRFFDARAKFTEVATQFSKTRWGERAEYDVALTLLTQGAFAGNDREARPIYTEALKAFEKFLINHPQSPLTAEAKFGIGSCYEELEQLDLAYETYRSIAFTYPSPKVIAIKLARIGERKAQKGVSSKGQR